MTKKRTDQRDEPIEQLLGQMVIYDYLSGDEMVLTVEQWRQLQSVAIRQIETAPVGVDAHDDGEPGRFGGPTANPNPNRIPDTLWRFWLALHNLEPSTELGGIYAYKSGYHSTRQDNQRSWQNNYSIREPEDQGGPADKSAAVDWTFPSAQRGDYTLINVYTKRLMASALDRNDPRLDGLREFYGQADKDTEVEGYDTRHLKPVTSDNSHLWHIHFSFDRNTIGLWEVMDAVLSVLRGEPLAAWKARRGAASTATPPVPVEVPTTGAIKPGSRTLRLADPRMEGDDVRYVQRWIGKSRAGTDDGVFGPMTDSAVRWYQKMRGLTVDGVVGPATWAQMGVKV